jgi:hypothetical protein
LLNGKFSKFERFLFFTAAALVVVGDQLSIAILFNTGLICAGVLVILLGAEQIIGSVGVYRMGFANGAQVVQLYRGLVVQLWGVIIMGAGAAIALVSLAQWLAPAQAASIGSSLQNSPGVAGLVLGAVGLMTALHGLLRALAGSSGSEVGRIAGLRDMLDRLIGAATVLFGLAMGFVGITLLVAPGIWSAIFDRLGAMIVGP